MKIVSIVWKLLTIDEKIWIISTYKKSVYRGSDADEYYEESADYES